MSDAFNQLPGDVAEDAALLREASDAFKQLEDQIAQVVIGQRDTVRALLAAVFCEGHVLLIGVPGLAKTLLVKTLSQALGWVFRRIQFTPDMMPGDIIGMELLQEDAGGARVMRFVPGPIFANIVLADEINRSPPKTQSALLEAMQELQVTSMGRCHTLDRPFIVVATQNPIEQEGTYPLPEAQLDRFMFSLWMDYPNVEDERRIVSESAAPNLADVDPVITQDRMMRYQALVRRLPLSRHVAAYAVDIIRATRPETDGGSDLANKYIRWGAGPRAGQHLVLAGKALAVLDGEPAVTAQHIRQAAPHVLRHRIVPNYQAAGEGLTAADLVNQIVAQVSEPQYTTG